MCGLLVADADVQSASLGGDGEVAVAEATDEVEGLPRGLLVSEAHGVGRDVFLDGRAHVGRRAEEAVGGHEAFEALMRALEVVRVDEQLDAAVAVGEVREHGARQELVPERLPEALHLAERLRVLRAALDVPDAVEVELALEVSLAAPRGVLAPLVGQDFSRLAERGDAPVERFDDELGALMVREVVRDDEARVVVHERRHVEALLTAEQEREDVRLPELIRLRALEASRRVLARPRLGTRLDEPGVVQDASHRGLRDTDGLEAREQVADATRAELRLRLAHGDDGLALHLSCDARRLRSLCAGGSERLGALLAVGAHPLPDGGRREAERPAD